MADLSVTASSVLAGSNAVTEQGVAGETITAGQPVYLDTSTRQYFKADANAAAAARQPRGLALNGASAGQPLAIARSGDITLNAVLTAGVTYYLSDTAGGICPLADVGTGEYFCIIGIAKSTTVLALSINYSGVSG
jgi:hypothetical protein